MKITEDIIKRFGLVDSGEGNGDSLIYDLRIYISTLVPFRGFWFMECDPRGRALNDHQVFILYTGEGRKKGFMVGGDMLTMMEVDMVAKTFQGIVS